MRTPGLQYLYLQKPLTLLVVIAALSVLPWIGMGDYYTKGEPREAAVSIPMLKGELILPHVYADEFAYKPPLQHWLTAAFSLPQGKVTPFASRLPAALAFLFMIGIYFVFFGQKLRKGHEAFVACLIMITCFELHRAAMTSRVDMLLTAFMVIGMISLFSWAENKRLKGLPWHIPLLLACAALTKGPVGIVLPLLVFGFYLLLTRRAFSVILGKLSLVAILSLIPLFVWYYLAYLKEGDALIDLMWAENFGRFFGLKNLDIRYNLGHEFPRSYIFLYLLGGFVPWTLLLFFSLFSLKLSGNIPGIKTIVRRLLSLERVKLFSLVAAVVILLFYCIPVSRRSVYLMPAYPFIAVFLAQYMLYLSEYKTKTFRFFSVFLTGLLGCVALCCLATLLGLVRPIEIVSHFIHHQKTLHDVSSIVQAFSQPGFLYVTLLLCLFYALGLLVYYLRKKNNLKILYATFGIYFAFYLLMDGVALPAFKNDSSSKPFIAKLQKKYAFTDDNVYVMNDLSRYANLYGPNFYLGNIFRNFETEQPEKGYFFSIPSDMETIREIYKDQYRFVLLEASPHPFNDVRNIVQLYQVWKIED